MYSPVLATLVYVCDGDKTLMLHRVKKENDLHEGKYNGLGGKFEDGEGPIACAIREVQEESGLTISELKFKGHLLFPKFDKQGRDWMVFVYRADNFAGELIENPPEGELFWIKNSKISELNLWDGDKHFLPYIHGEQTFDGVFKYVDGSLENYQITLS